MRHGFHHIHLQNSHILHLILDSLLLLFVFIFGYCCSNRHLFLCDFSVEKKNPLLREFPPTAGSLFPQGFSSRGGRYFLFSVIRFRTVSAVVPSPKFMERQKHLSWGLEYSTCKICCRKLFPIEGLLASSILTRMHVFLPSSRFHRRSTSLLPRKYLNTGNRKVL